jgi:prolyl-tRNA editing enzyme YbaK/EbsC (Cys-tRNA(Pro) deacylase)
MDANELEILKALANEKRLQILYWLKAPEQHFPPHKEDIAERLAGSVTGTILPFSFNPELNLMVDPSLLTNTEIYFNAARLDRSIVLKTSDYVALANPRLERITGSRP